MDRTYSNPCNYNISYNFYSIDNKSTVCTRIVYSKKSLFKLFIPHFHHNLKRIHSHLKSHFIMLLNQVTSCRFKLKGAFVFQMSSRNLRPPASLASPAGSTRRGYLSAETTRPPLICGENRRWVAFVGAEITGRKEERTAPSYLGEWTRKGYEFSSFLKE